MGAEGITQIAQIPEIAPNRLARHGKPLSQTLHLYPPVTSQHGKDLFLSCRQIHAPLRQTLIGTIYGKRDFRASIDFRLIFENVRFSTLIWVATHQTKQWEWRDTQVSFTRRSTSGYGCGCQRCLHRRG